MSFAKPQFKNRYQNFIAGEWVNPMDGQYFTNVSPVDGQACCEIPRSDKKDVDRAVEAAWQAAKNLVQDCGRRSARPCCTRSPTAWRPTSRDSPLPRHGTTARRSGRP